MSKKGEQSSTTELEDLREEVSELKQTVSRLASQVEGLLNNQSHVRIDPNAEASGEHDMGDEESVIRVRLNRNYFAEGVKLSAGTMLTRVPREVAQHLADNDIGRIQVDA